MEGRIEKEIGIKIQAYQRNFGFLEDRAVEIDFGNYIARPEFREQLPEAQLERYARHLRAWLEKNAPTFKRVQRADIRDAPVMKGVFFLVFLCWPQSFFSQSGPMLWTSKPVEFRHFPTILKWRFLKVTIIWAKRKQASRLAERG